MRPFKLVRLISLIWLFSAARPEGSQWTSDIILTLLTMPLPVVFIKKTLKESSALTLLQDRNAFKGGAHRYLKQNLSALLHVPKSLIALEMLIEPNILFVISSDVLSVSIIGWWEIYRVSLKKGNPSFRVHYSIIKFFSRNVHIIGKLIFSSFIWHHNHDGRVTHDWAGTICTWYGTLTFVQGKWGSYAHVKNQNEPNVAANHLFLTIGFLLVPFQVVIGHVWFIDHVYGVIWKKRTWAFQWCVHLNKKKS